jgi:hypothetical protein
MKKLFTSLNIIFLSLLFSIVAQAGVIKGKVTDSKGGILPYATIFIQGTTNGVSANANGSYELQVAPGSYKVICQYIGFSQSVFTVSVNGDEIITHNFSLKEQSLNMKEVTVHANAEDPAYEIIRKTIARRNFHLGQVKSFQTGIYLKGVAHTRSTPDKVFGQKVDKGEMGVDTAGKGIVFLVEEQADYYSEKPDKKRTVIHSVQQSGDPNGMGFSQLPSVITFYENNINIFSSRGFVSPVSDNAIHYYKYKFLGEFRENGYTIDKIEVTPRRPYEPLFAGTIYIAEGDWAIHSLSMTLTGKANLDFFDTVRINQLFLPLKEDTWVIKNQVLYFTMNLLGFDITGNFVTVYDKQKVNEPIPDTIFQKKIISEYDKTANKKDSAYWRETRPIPLEADEKKDYVIKDSIRKREEDPRYIDSIRKVDNKIKIGQFFLLGITQTAKGSKDVFHTNSVLLGLLNYNTVEGLVIAPKFTWRHSIDSSNALETRIGLRYGLSNTHFNAISRITYTHNNRHWIGRSLQLGVEGGKYVFQYNPENPVPELYNTINTLFYTQNYLKIYERWNAGVFFTQNLSNGFNWDLRFAYQQRLPLENTTWFTWGSDGKTNFTPDYPKELQNVLWEKHDAVLASASVSYQPGYTYTKYPDYISPHKSRWPVFTLNYQKGIPGVLNSKVDFDKWRFKIEQYIRLKLLGALNYNIAIGGFLNKNYVSLPDMMHLYGNNYSALPIGFYMHGFELAPYYLYSNTESNYLEAHIEYDLLGLITNKIPILRQAHWYAVLGTNTFYASSNDYYTEAFVGLDNIGFKIMRGIRVDFVESWDSHMQNATGLRLGFKLGNGVTVNTGNDANGEW